MIANIPVVTIFDWRTVVGRADIDDEFITIKIPKRHLIQIFVD